MGREVSGMTDAQLPLLDPSAPPVPDWCDLRCCDVAELLADLAERGVRVDCVVADPPWAYERGMMLPRRTADNHYACLPMTDIFDHLRAARRLAAPGSRCLLWTTWAMLPALALSTSSTSVDVTLGGWRWMSGGSWTKMDAPDDEGGGMGQPGIGYHLRSSESEPYLCLLGPGPHARADVPGSWTATTSGRHSEKPVDLQARIIAGWCPPGGLVLDLYAGLGSVARAVHRAGGGRRYVGAELDTERHAGALALLAQEVSHGAY